MLTANLSGNSFFGQLPSLPSSLVVLDVSRNQFGGQLPAPLPSNLVTFRADHNQLTGGVPPVGGCSARELLAGWQRGAARARSGTARQLALP
jgi:hypothetical protein